MRWRFVDRIDRFEPWRLIAVTKVASLEEYGLLDRLGRRGALPESLVLEVCVQAGRWLAARSSEFRAMALLGGVEGFRLDGEAGPGDALAVTFTVSGRSERELRGEAEARVGTRLVARGRLDFDLADLAAYGDPALARSWWEELDGSP